MTKKQLQALNKKLSTLKLKTSPITLPFIIFSFIGFHFSKWNLSIDEMLRHGTNVHDVVVEGKSYTEKTYSKDKGRDPTEFDDNSWNEVGGCQFDMSEDAPLPVLLISLGRSGSSVTWDTIARLAGEAPVRKAYEITGGNMTKSINFFNTIPPNVGDKWAILQSCKIQKRKSSRITGEVFGKGGISGFQWKPYKATWDHEYAINGLKRIADQRNPQIKVIFLRRNPLSRLISNIRHAGHIRTDELPAHCPVDDLECIKKHNELNRGITLPTGKELFIHLRQGLSNDIEIEDRLLAYGISHVSVGYEELYHSNTAFEWMRIFKFLGRGPMTDLKMDTVQATFSMASTSSRRLNETIANYDDVAKTLIGSDLEYLLYTN